MTLRIHALRTKLAAAAIGVAVLAAGQALASNHDCQSFRMPSGAPAFHDRAPGPGLRIPD